MTIFYNMVKRVAVAASGTRVLKIPFKVSWLCAVIKNDLSLTSTHSSSSSSSSESTTRIEVSSLRRVILRSVSFLLYFALNLIYVSQPFMHEIVSPTIPIIMSYRLIECTVQICRCLNILLHVVALTREMSVSAYFAPR
jgi:hypothetical protein